MTTAGLQQPLLGIATGICILSLCTTEALCWQWEPMTWDLRIKALQAHLLPHQSDKLWSILDCHMTGHQKTAAVWALYSHINQARWVSACSLLGGSGMPDDTSSLPASVAKIAAHAPAQSCKMHCMKKCNI